MADFPKPLEHQDAHTKDDQTLRQEAQAYLAKSPALQVISELVDILRHVAPPWWTPEVLRAAHGAGKRIGWYRQRPDLRQQITTTITGLTPKIARRKAPEFQAALIDSALDDGDVTCRTFEESFGSRDLAVYGAADELWRLFRKCMPWAQSTPPHQELVGSLLRVLLADKGAEGLTRKPILGAWEVRTSIDSTVWHTRMPLEVRVAIDEARFKKEKTTPREGFHAVHDLAIAEPAMIASHIPLKDLERIFDSAEKLMGIVPVALPSEAKSTADGAAGAGARGKRGSQPSAKEAAATAATPGPSALAANGGTTPASTATPAAIPSLSATSYIMASSTASNTIPTPVPASWGPEPSTGDGSVDASEDLIVELDDPADSQHGIRVKS